MVDTWTTDHQGNYGGLHYIEAECTPTTNLRGVFRTDDNGYYHYKTVVPYHYSVPMHGPVGEFMKNLNRQGVRPAHLHFIVRADRFQDCVTQLFPENDPHFDNDATFQTLVPGVKKYPLRI